MPKKIRNEFDKYLTYENLMKAHNKAKRGKGLKKDVILFELKKEEYILWLYEELKNGTYHHGGYTVFYVTEPKLRKIEKSRYMDRIVHTWIVDSFLKKYFMSSFIYHSYACIEGKGMHRAALYVQECMQHAKYKWKEYYILKMDVSKYFHSINRNILYSILEKKIEDEKVKWILKEIIYSGEQTDTGIQIGNYTSQIFANIYLNEVDQFIKHELKIRYYARYLDDSIIIVKTKEEAKRALEEITKFLREKLKLELNSKTQIFKSKQGVNFCGYKINEYRMKLRDRGKRALKNKIKKLKNEIKNGTMTSKEAKRYLAGHMGYIQYADINNLKHRLFYIRDKSDGGANRAYRGGNFNNNGSNNPASYRNNNNPSNYNNNIGFRVGL